MPYLPDASCLDYIYFAGFAFICIVDADGFNPHNYSGYRLAMGWGMVGGKLCMFQMSILINTFVDCHNKF